MINSVQLKQKAYSCEHIILKKKIKFYHKCPVCKEKIEIQVERDYLKKVSKYPFPHLVIKTHSYPNIPAHPSASKIARLTNNPHLKDFDLFTRISHLNSHLLFLKQISSIFETYAKDTLLEPIPDYLYLLCQLITEKKIHPTKLQEEQKAKLTRLNWISINENKITLSPLGEKIILKIAASISLPKDTEPAINQNTPTDITSIKTFMKKTIEILSD
jgi:hypothetical protein